MLLLIDLKCFSMKMTLDLLHEFANTEVFCLFHNCMWRSWHSEVKIYFLALCEQTDGLSTFNRTLRSYLICVYVSVSLSLSKRLTDTDTQLFTGLSVLSLDTFAAKQDLFVDFLRKRTGWLLTLNRSSCSYNWFFVFWLGLLGVFTTPSNFWIQFFHPNVFEENLRRRSRRRIYFLVYDFSSFHRDILRDTISWECVVKDDCVRTCWIELKSFLLSKFDVDPIHSVFWCFFHLFWWYHARRSASRSNLFGSLYFFAS